MELENLDLIEEMNEIEETETVDKYEQIEDIAKTSVLRYDIPNVERAIVTGEPEVIASRLDSIQGDEVEGARGTCGLTSIANICRISGMNVTEGMVVTYALENGLCRYDPWSAGNTGGIVGEDAVKILDALNVDAHVETAAECNLEGIAEAIESGRGVIAGVDAGGLWNDPAYTQTYFGMPVANHYITVTGTARDADTGELSGFYICDSGRGWASDACRYISIEKFSEIYNPFVKEADVVITDGPIRNC